MTKSLFRKTCASLTMLLIATVAISRVDAKPPKIVKLDIEKGAGYTASFGPSSLFMTSVKEGAKAHYLEFDLQGKSKTRHAYAPSVTSGQPPKYTNAPDGIVSPDGTQWIFRSPTADDAEGHETLWLMDLKTQSMKALLHDLDTASNPTWFADGKRIWYFTDASRFEKPADKVWKTLDIVSGDQATLCTKETPSALTVFPDGNHLLAEDFKRDSSRAYVASMDCGTITILMPSGGWGSSGPGFAAISPSGSHIAITNGGGKLWIFDTNSGDSTQPVTSEVATVEWLDDSTILYTATRKASPKADYAYAMDAMVVDISGGKAEYVLPKNEKCSDGSMATSSLTHRAVLTRECIGTKDRVWYLVLGTK